VSNERLRKSEHCIAYSDGNGTGRPPDPLPTEIPRGDEMGMKAIPIRVLRDDREDVPLRSATRLNFGREFSPLDYTRILVKSYGVVDPRSMDALLGQWRAVKGETRARQGQVVWLKCNALSPRESECVVAD